MWEFRFLEVFKTLRSLLLLSVNLKIKEQTTIVLKQFMRSVVSQIQLVIYDANEISQEFVDFALDTKTKLVKQMEQLENIKSVEGFYKTIRDFINRLDKELELIQYDEQNDLRQVLEEIKW